MSTLSHFVKWLFLTIFVFCLFLDCRLSGSTETLNFVGFSSFKVYFIELVFLMHHSKFHLDTLRNDRVMMLLLSAIYFMAKTFAFVELMSLLLFPLHSLVPAILNFL